MANGILMICTKCKQDKALNQFCKGEKRCKQCRKDYYDVNKEKIVLRKKQYRETHKLEEQEYYKSNEYKAKKKLYRENNKEHLKSLRKQREQDNPKPKKIRSKKSLDEIREYKNKWAREYYKNNYTTNLSFKLKQVLRARIRGAIKNQFSKKADKSIALLGNSIENIRMYLESKFQKGMTWENYGEWEIDHIIPVSVFDLTNPEEQKKCFHYTNLQPLWWQDNNTKSNKYEF